MKEKFRQFMLGRYGTDSLNQCLNIAAIALLVLSLVTGLNLFYTLALVLWGYSIFRMMSRNISKRTAENYRFYNAKSALNNTIAQKKKEFSQRKQYHYYKCPQCGQKLRVPRGRGKIQISCPKCSKQFIKKS